MTVLSAERPAAVGHALPPAALRRNGTPKWEIAGYFAIVLLALALRLFHLEGPSLRGDEAFGFFFARQPVGDMFRAMVTTEPHPPLFYLLFGGWMQVAGWSEFSLRFFSVFFGVLSVPLVGALGRRLFNEGAGLVASIVLAIAPLQVWNAQDARMFTLAVAVTLATTFLLAGFINAAERTGRMPVLGAAAYVALTLIGLFSLYHTAFILIFHNLAALLWLRRPRRVALTWLAIQAAVAAIYVPWLVLARTALFGHGGNGFSPGLWGGIRNAFEVLTVGETLPAEVAGSAALAVFVWLVVAVALAAQRWPRGTLFALLYFIVPALVVIGLALVRPVYQPRYVIPAQPGFALLAGAGIAALLTPAWRYVQARRSRGTASTSRRQAAISPAGRHGLLQAAAGLAGLLLLAGTAAYALSNYWFDPRFVKASGWTQATNYIKDNWQSGDFVVLNVPDPSFGYYFRDDERSAILPERVPVDPVATGQALAGLTERHSRIWLVPFRSPTWDAEGFVEGWLERSAQTAERREFQNVRLVLFDTRRADLAPAERLDVSFGDGIDLAGFQVDRSELPMKLRVTLFWQAREVPSRDYTVYTHLLAPDGSLVTQRDNPPRGGTYPTGQWLPGELVADTYVLDLPDPVPTGPLRLKVGLYAPDSGQRLLTESGADGAVLPEIETP